MKKQQMKKYTLALKNEIAVPEKVVIIAKDRETALQIALGIVGKDK